MKKLLTILLALLLLLSAAACTKKEEEKPAAADPVQFKTIGDVLDYESPSSSCYEDLYVHVFEKDGVFYRVEADLTEDLFQKVFDIDFFDPDKEQKTKALLGDLPVKQTFVLSDVLLSQAELDALAGKTGQDLLNMGFVPQGSYGFSEDMSWASLDKGPFDYQFNFVEHVPVEEDDPNVAEVIRTLTVKDAAYSAVSDYSTEHDFDLKGGRTLAEYEGQFNDEDETVFYSIPEIPLAESPFKTIGDAFACQSETYQATAAEDKYIYVFAKDGAYYRVEAAITQELLDKIDALDFLDENYSQNLTDLIGPLPITRVADLSACIPPQEELDALVGATGQELLDMGFEYGSGYTFFDKAEMYLVKDLCEYHFYFNETVPERENYDEALDEIMQGLTVAKVEFFQMSDICSDPYLAY